VAKGLDLGLEGRKAIVCGSSSGIGRACAEALGMAGARLVLNGRNADSLAQTADNIAEKLGESVEWVVADVQTTAGRQKILDSCPDPDILVNNAAGPPTGDFRGFDEQVWLDAASKTMIAPIMLIRGVLDGMIERKWGRIISITSSAVKAPLPLLGLSNGARSGFTGFIAGLAREVAESGVTINNLLPGRIETDRLGRYVSDVAVSRGCSEDEAARSMLAANPMKRFGKADEIGAFCAFLASRQAAYVTGQNILVDGGEFPGI
jgi:3-oxoacyl-[acyl-carrier protein] reductase